MSVPVYPPVEPGFFRLTQSDVNAYLKCGIAYQLRRESKNRHATVRMLVGSAVAAGAKDDNREKIAQGGGPGVGLNAIIEASVSAYEAEMASSDVDATKFERDLGKDGAANAAREYKAGISPMIREVVAAEEPIIARFGGVEGLELAGTPDVITPDGVGDLKVGKPWGGDDADESRQLTAYSILHRAKRGGYPARLWIDNVASAKGSWSAGRIHTHRDEKHYAAFLEIMKRVRAGIEAGNFLPAPERAWWCSAMWCPFFHKQCPVT